jgi:putative PIN family toxin of toxin-antitoxin system
VRAVLDPNVLISALLSPAGSPARVLRAWDAGQFELVVSPLLLAELERALAYPKLRARITTEEAGMVSQWLRRSALEIADPDSPPPVRSSDAGDDYLIALAAAQSAALVSGDKHLLALAEAMPVFSPRAFLELLDREAV